MSSELYKRDTYLNKGIPRIFNKHIYEYDMHHAGISISRELNLLPDDVLDRIENKAKNKKEIAVLLGKIQKKNSEYKEGLKNGFEEMRKRFFNANELEDEDILSIKKDAIFVFKPCNMLTFGEVVFSLKHDYTSYIYTGPYEFYYQSDVSFDLEKREGFILEGLDVKGLGDELIYLHKDYVIQFIKKVFYKMEQEGKENVLRYIRVMSDRYKRLELDPGFYREFNRESNYRSKDENITYSFITPMLLPSIDISYNYQNVILAMLKAVL